MRLQSLWTEWTFCQLSVNFIPVQWNLAGLQVRVAGADGEPWVHRGCGHGSEDQFDNLFYTRMDQLLNIDQQRTQ